MKKSAYNGSERPTPALSIAIPKSLKDGLEVSWGMKGPMLELILQDVAAALDKDREKVLNLVTTEQLNCRKIGEILDDS